jgi:hypothetical protein
MGPSMSSSEPFYMNGITMNANKREISDLPENQVAEKFYYSPFHNSMFVMPCGKILRFPGGVFATTNAWEQSELDKAIAVNGNHALSHTQMALRENTALILREVGGRGNTGAFNSGTVGRMAQQSGR